MATSCHDDAVADPTPDPDEADPTTRDPWLTMLDNRVRHDHDGR
jgi:hypothetical protein